MNKNMKAAAERAGWSDVEDFVKYLTGTLMPDLRESGRDATADDFATAVAIIEAANEN